MGLMNDGESIAHSMESAWLRGKHGRYTHYVVTVAALSVRFACLVAARVGRANGDERSMLQHGDQWLKGCKARTARVSALLKDPVMR